MVAKNYKTQNVSGKSTAGEGLRLKRNNRGSILICMVFPVDMQCKQTSQSAEVVIVITVEREREREREPLTPTLPPYGHIVVNPNIAL